MALRTEIRRCLALLPEDTTTRDALDRMVLAADLYIMAANSRTVDVADFVRLGERFEVTFAAALLLVFRLDASTEDPVSEMRVPAA